MFHILVVEDDTNTVMCLATTATHLSRLVTV